MTNSTAMSYANQATSSAHRARIAARSEDYELAFKRLEEAFEEMKQAVNSLANKQ